MLTVGCICEAKGITREVQIRKPLLIDNDQKSWNEGGDSTCQLKKK